MKKYKVGRYIFLSVLGFIIFGVGLTLIKPLQETEGMLKTLPYVCVGVGAGVFGGNLGAAISSRIMIMNPQVAKQSEIDQKDERNQTICIKAKARTYDFMIYAYAAILLAFSLMQVDIFVILTLVAVYLLFITTNAYYLTKYHKEM